MVPARDSDAPPAGGFGEPGPSSSNFGPIGPAPTRANPPHAFRCTGSSISLVALMLVAVALGGVLLCGVEYARGKGAAVRKAESLHMGEK